MSKTTDREKLDQMQAKTEKQIAELQERLQRERKKQAQLRARAAAADRKADAHNKVVLGAVTAKLFFDGRVPAVAGSEEPAEVMQKLTDLQHYAEIGQLIEDSIGQRITDMDALRSYLQQYAYAIARTQPAPAEPKKPDDDSGDSGFFF